MKERVYQQEYQADIGTSGTKTYDLDFNSPITELLLGFDATNGASGNLNNPIELNISKIELVDGGEVLWSLPGEVALAYASHLANKLPISNRTNAISDTPYQVIPIRFGRYLFDPIFAFNPLGHKNPQLRFTFDEATIRAAGGTGFVSDSFAFSLFVRLMENMDTAPTAFLSCRDIETYTSLASGEPKTDLPTDKILRSIFVRMYESGVFYGTDISKLKLSANGGEYVPFELYTWNLVDIMAEHFSPLKIPNYFQCDGSEAMQTWIAHDNDSQIRAHVAGQIVGGSSPASAQMTIYTREHDGTTVSRAVHYSVTGWGFHNTLIYPFGDLMNPNDWFDVRELRKLELFQTQGGAGADVNVCVESVYQY